MSGDERMTDLLSVVMPCYNERDTIREIVARVRAAPMNLELVIVDDGSTDGTRAILAEIEREGARVIYREKNEGKGAALRDGFAAAGGDVIVIQDADLSMTPRSSPISTLPSAGGRPTWSTARASAASPSACTCSGTRRGTGC